jgi:hypothetical protein
MFSVKVALFAFISFAALALAIPSPVGQLQPGSQDPRALILSCNDQLAVAVLPLRPSHLHLARLMLTSPA